jgi:L-threonylcarbamoyladenylate synthase
MNDRRAALDEAAEEILSGGLVVIPTETVYGLAANAFDRRAVAKVFEAKGRPQDNPLIVHISNEKMLEGVAEGVSGCARRLMEAFWPGPLSLVLRAGAGVPDIVTAGLDTVAVRMPGLELTRDIISAAGVPLAAPSANRSGGVSPTTAMHAFEDMAGRVGLIIDGGPCGVGVESTVVNAAGDTPVILRPGHITARMIEEACGKKPGSAGPRQDGAPPSPGMKYRHYAPKARVLVFEGDKKDVAKHVNEMYYLFKEKRPVVFCGDGCAGLYEGLDTVSLGSGAGEAERRVFSCLREADSCGYGVVLFHYTGDMGAAVKNRIEKSAGMAEGDMPCNTEVK